MKEAFKPTNRREFFRQSTGLAITALLGGCNSCQKDPKPKAPETEKKPTADVAKPEPPKTEATPEELEAFSIMPKIERVEKDAASYRPPGLEITDEAFKAASTKYAEAVQKLTINQYFRDMAEGKKSNSDIASDYYKALFQSAKDIPEFKSYAEGIESRGGDTHIASLIVHLKPLLIPSGTYFDIDHIPAVDPQTGEIKKWTQLRMHRIEEQETYKCSGKRSSVSVPVLELGPAYIQNASNARGIIAKFDPEIDIITHRRDQNEAKLDRHLDFLDKHGLKPDSVSREELLAIVQRDTINHELTHALLDEFYKKYGRGADATFHVPFQYPFYTGMVAPLSDNYTATHFNELAAIGSEIYNAEGDVPLSLYQHLSGSSDKHDPTHGEMLANRLVTYITIGRAPDSEQRKQIIETIKQAGVMNNHELIQMVRDTFSETDRKVVGAMMYDLGIQMIQAAEKGELQRIK